MRDPFYGVLPVYTLSFVDAAGAFTQEVHLEKMSVQSAGKRDLDVSKGNLEAPCANPKAGNPRIRHDMVATISPDFDGLAGTITIKGQPRSDMTALTRAFGYTYYGEFNESAGSASNDLSDLFTRKRFVPDGGLTLTGGPSGSWPSKDVFLKLTRESGDEYSDFGPVNAEAVALAGTLEPGDILTSAVHGVFQVRGVANEGGFERARLLR